MSADPELVKLIQAARREWERSFPAPETVASATVDMAIAAALGGKVIVRKEGECLVHLVVGSTIAPTAEEVRQTVHALGAPECVEAVEQALARGRAAEVRYDELLAKHTELAETSLDLAETALREGKVAETRVAELEAALDALVSGIDAGFRKTAAVGPLIHNELINARRVLVHQSASEGTQP